MADTRPRVKVQSAERVNIESAQTIMVTAADSESHSGYHRHDGGIGRYILVHCKRVD